MCFVFGVMSSQCGSQSVSYFRVLHDVANVCGKFNRTPIRTGRGIGSIHRLQTGLCCTHLRVLSYDNITEIKTGLRRDGTCKYILWIVGINYHGVMNAKHMQLSPSSGCTVEYGGKLTQETKLTVIQFQFCNHAVCCIYASSNERHAFNALVPEGIQSGFTPTQHALNTHRM